MSRAVRVPPLLALAGLATACVAPRSPDPATLLPGLPDLAALATAAPAPAADNEPLAALAWAGLDAGTRRGSWMDPRLPPRVAAALLEEGHPPEVPGVTVEAPQPGDDTLVGPNRQPAWTTRRPFARTRAYVIAPGQVEFEQWWRFEEPREGGPEHLFQSEIEVGLPHRFQLDLYQNTERIPGRGVIDSVGQQVELRWALAKWGEIPLNPTLYAEYKFNRHAPNALEGKILLAGSLGPRWHGGFNAVVEQELGPPRSTELAATAAVAYSAIPRSLTTGIEVEWARVTEDGSRGAPAYELKVGPSIQWRPGPRWHIDLVPLWGASHDAARLTVFVILGFDFGGPAVKEAYSGPTSLRSK